MGLSRKKKGKVKPEMNVTPLVDVFLVLLIIFMVILPAAVSELNIEMTKISNPDKESEGDEEPFVLSVDRDGNLYFEDYRVEPDQLGDHLRNANAAEPTRKLVLVGDYRLEYGDVREVMATIQDVGFPGVNLRATKAALDNAAAFAKSIRRSDDTAN